MFFKYGTSENASFLWGLQYAMVTSDMIDLFLSKGNHGPECVHAAFESWPERADVYW